MQRQRPLRLCMGFFSKVQLAKAHLERIEKVEAANE
jgi:hypothetical protein